jgi:hypothetical protein
LLDSCFSKSTSLLAIASRSQSACTHIRIRCLTCSRYSSSTEWNQLATSSGMSLCAGTSG